MSGSKRWELDGCMSLLLAPYSYNRSETGTSLRAVSAYAVTRLPQKGRVVAPVTRRAAVCGCVYTANKKGEETRVVIELRVVHLGTRRVAIRQLR